MSNIALDCLDYEVLYTKGAENKVADFLSRIESDTDEKVNDEVEQFERFIYDLPSSGPELVQLIREEQLKDQAIMFARDQVLKFGFVSKGRYRGQHLTISDGMLTRDGKILAPQAVTGSVLTMTHNKAHPGVRRTTFLVKEKFTWNGLSDNVRKFCRKCEICNRHKHRSGPREPITPITIASYPRQVIAYDVATLPWGFGNRYFLQIRDMFSKWVELVPMCNQTSHTIVEALEAAWILRHGPPEVCLSDQRQTWTELKYAMPCENGGRETQILPPITLKHMVNPRVIYKLPNKPYVACSPRKNFRNRLCPKYCRK